MEDVTLELELRDTVVLSVTLELMLGDRDGDTVAVVDWLRVSVGKIEELKVADDVADKEMDSLEDEDLDTVRDLVREVETAVVREGEAEGLIERLEAAVAEGERIWVWVNVDHPDQDTVAVEDMVMDLLEDMETLSDEEGVLLEDVVDDELPEILELELPVTLVLCDTAVVGEPLELDDVVAETLVL